MAITIVSVVSIVVYWMPRNDALQAEPGLLGDIDARDPTARPIDGAANMNPSGVVQAEHLEPVDENSNRGNRGVADGKSETPFIEQMPGTAPAGNYHSSEFGYSVKLNATPWTRWDDLRSVAPSAEWGALLGNYGRFLVIPVVLVDTSEPQEDVDRELLEEFGFEPPAQPPTELEKFQRQGTAGHIYQLTREIAGRENVYQIWILRRNRNAYLVAAWVDRNAAARALGISRSPSDADRDRMQSQLDSQIDAQLDDVLNRFELDNAPAAVVPTVSSEIPRVRSRPRARSLRAVGQ
jgi:hypothetical protein